MSRVEIAEQAMRDAIAINSWWRENRSAAADAFVDDLAWVARLLAETAMLGRRVRVRGARNVRRVLTPRTLHHVYYTVDPSDDVVLVMRIWSARRGRRPRM